MQPMQTAAEAWMPILGVARLRGRARERRASRARARAGR